MTLARRKILIAGMGTSPAVLTNVVWARDWRVRFCSYERVMGKLVDEIWKSLARTARGFGIISPRERMTNERQIDR